MTRFAVLGPPGSGKSVQAQRLAEWLKVPVVSTGALLRKIDDPGVQAAMSRGALVDTRIVSQVIARELSKPETASGFVLDGSPRTLREARMIERNWPLDLFIHLDVSQNTSIRRLSERQGGRRDDSPDIIFRRVVDYPAMIAEVLYYYQCLGKLCCVPAEGIPDEVFEFVKKTATGMRCCLRYERVGRIRA